MPHALTFGEFEIDTAKQTVRRGGEPLKVGQRAMALLGALVQAGGVTVSKHELMDRAWPGLFVEEANLTVQISALRRLLGPAPDGGDWIATVPGLGYRFAAPKAPVPDGRPGLVVLPFDHAEGDVDAGYLADGVVTDLVAALTSFKSLSVVSRSVAFAYRGHGVDSRNVARELGLQYVLEGSLRRNGARLRVTTQLVDGASGTQIWAERFEGVLDDVFAVQDRIVESVAVRVQPSVQLHELEKLRRHRPASVSTYAILLRAQADLMDESEAANRRAFSLLQSAILAEPNNAAILMQASWALEHRHTMGWSALGPDDVDLCLRYARRALQHANGDANIMAQCGMSLLQAGRDYRSGMAVIRAAAEANPNSIFALAAFGVASIHCGELDEAEALLRRVVTLASLDPDVRFALCGLSMIEIIRRAHEKALALAGHALAVNQHFDATYWMLIAANAHLGRMSEARRYRDALLALTPSVTVSSIRAGQPAMIPSRIEPILDGLRLAGLPE